jgi:hypothetical protein
MQMYLNLEACQADGTSYRLGIGCVLHPAIASMMALLARLI